MANQSLGQTLSQALQQIKQLARTTAAFAKARLSKDGSRLGTGLALLTGALVAVASLVPLLILALVWGLVELDIRPWAAHLITAGLVALAAVALALGSKALLKRVAASIGQTAALISQSVAALGGTKPPVSGQNSASPAPPGSSGTGPSAAPGASG
ncbi:MAG: phage holin family protein [Bifidobacteriaceae bacterium]|jgi:hypothetical protein|nr:phage holin family protein [Bifidobacteriaceae bacterium]